MPGILPEGFPMQNSGYIAKAACRGYRPPRLSSYRVHERPHLLARLAKERIITRFVVAPAGYGKTGLAIEYAETMFSWAHVFWFNAESPCFIRDLDDGDLAHESLSIDSETKLVVIDDVPQLDAKRAQLLSGEIDAWLDRGCEVLVTCAPSCDTFGGLQVDRMRVGPRELLLNDEEIEAVLTEESRSRQTASQVPAACRVPLLVWDASAASASQFVAQNLKEDLPADVLLAICSAYVLRQGALSDISKLVSASGRSIEGELDDYPHLGFNGEEGRFEAPDIDADVIARAMKGKLDIMVGCSPFETRDSLVRAWVDILMGQDESAGRACDVMRCLSVSQERASWALAHARAIVGAGCFLPAYRLIKSLKRGMYSSKDRVGAFEALCLRMLGDSKSAVQRAKQCAFESGASADARAVDLLLVAQLGSGTLQRNASSELSRWAAAIESRGKRSPAWHEALVVAWHAWDDGVGSLCAAWRRLHDEGADDEALCVIASWLFGAIADGGLEWAAGAGADLSAVEHYVKGRLEGGDAPADFYAVSAGLSLEHAHDRGMPLSEGALRASSLLVLRRAEVAMLVQRREFEHEAGKSRTRATDKSLPALPALPNAMPLPALRREVPPLEVWAFGRFEVAIGGVILPESCFTRKRTKLLLVLLAANQGRDLSIDAIVSAMWPEQDIKAARKNFYSVWSQLKRVLTLPDDTCPYLVKHQFGCRLDERFVQSDIARLDDICRELLFGRVDFDAWLKLYSEIDRNYIGEFMPTEQANSLIVKTRADYRNRLVDSLVAGALRLVDAGGAQSAIWFARSALAHDKTREDAYVALMRAQIASGQRTAAMMTYHTCRRTLADDLGIDPSPETTALYESLLE